MAEWVKTECFSIHMLTTEKLYILIISKHDFCSFKGLEEIILIDFSTIVSTSSIGKVFLVVPF